MARGWESKSVESQIEAGGQYRKASPAKVITPEELNLVRQKESLILTRTRVMRDIETSSNPRYRTLMEKTLAELNAKLSALDK